MFVCVCMCVWCVGTLSVSKYINRGGGSVAKSNHRHGVQRGVRTDNNNVIAVVVITGGRPGKMILLYSNN